MHAYRGPKEWIIDARSKKNFWNKQVNKRREISTNKISIIYDIDLLRISKRNATHLRKKFLETKENDKSKKQSTTKSNIKKKDTKGPKTAKRAICYSVKE